MGPDSILEDCSRSAYEEIGRVCMPQVDGHGLTINYDVQGRASRFC
jgi:hypothetical protein